MPRFEQDLVQVLAEVAATIPRRDVVLYDTLHVGTSTHAKVLLAFKTRMDAEEFQDVMTCCAASLLSKHVFLKRFGPASVGSLVIFDSQLYAPPPPRPPTPPSDLFTASVAFAGMVVGVAVLIVLALFVYLRRLFKRQFPELDKRKQLYLFVGPAAARVAPTELNPMYPMLTAPSASSTPLALPATESIFSDVDAAALPLPPPMLEYPPSQHPELAESTAASAAEQPERSAAESEQPQPTLQPGTGEADDAQLEREVLAQGEEVPDASQASAVEAAEEPPVATLEERAAIHVGVDEASATLSTETDGVVRVPVREMEPENDILVGYGLHPWRQAQVKDKWREIMDAY